MRSVARLSPPLAVLLAAGLLAAAPSDYVVAAFSNMRPGGAVVGWSELRLGDAERSRYALVEDGGAVVVRGQADGSASGLVRRFDLNPAQFPVLTWRWKADNVIAGGDMRRKGGDDYAARVYVTFDYDPARLPFGDRVKHRALRALGYDDLPLRALSYVWANQPGRTEIVPNAFTDWVYMVPVEAGAAHVGTWRAERRDLVADYRAAFGEDPPNISGVAIMTDGDNTGGAATAYFGDIRLGAR